MNPLRFRQSDCRFVIRFTNDHRLIYDSGSSIVIDHHGDICVTDGDGLQRQIDREEWLDVIVDAGHVVTNRWRETY